MQLTTHPIRKKQFPAESKRPYQSTSGTEVFTVKGQKKVRQFDYLPHTPKKRHLGHPIALGDDVIVLIDFKPRKSLVKMAERLLKSRGTSPGAGTYEDLIKKQIRNISKYFFTKMIEDGIKPKIHEIVPKATGRLQRGMVATLNRSVRQIGTLPHILKLNTLDNLGNPVYYANPVNNMPTDWLAHPPNEPLIRKIKGRTYHLFDPGAETDWYSKVIDYAQQYIKKNVGLIYKALVAQYGINLVSISIYQNIKKNMKFK